MLIGEGSTTAKVEKEEVEVGIQHDPTNKRTLTSCAPLNLKHPVHRASRPGEGGHLITIYCTLHRLRWQRK